MIQTTSLLLISIIAVSFLLQVEGNPFLISDDRVRKLDIAPVLGRGYSIMTDTYMSTCLIVDDTTVPSFNYDYFYTEISDMSNMELSMGGSMSGSLSYGVVMAEGGASFSTTAKVQKQSKMITATMKIERYYSSVKEEVSPLAADAFALLDRQDYVGFFKACGPNYVRSIRRAQEVTAMFKFTTTSNELSSDFSSNLKVSNPLAGSVEASLSGSSKFDSVNSSLEIKIVGFGLGLTQEGSETMVATSIDEAMNVFRFAFNSMTKADDAAHIGMIYGIEVLPWANNLAFQVAAKLSSENVIIPLPRSVIPRALIFATNATTSKPTYENRETYSCKDPGAVVDKHGYCCEEEQMYDTATSAYLGAACSTKDNWPNCICRPQRNLDKSLIRDNMSNNGEFVARLDNIMRYKLAQLGQAEKCTSAANSIPDDYLYRVVKANDAVKYDAAVGITLTALEVKLAMDPTRDYSLVRILGFELDEWIEMYMTPCLSALYGMNVGNTPSPDVSYFMAYPWYTHSECMKLSCLTANNRWDRRFGNCKPGIIAGASSSGDDDYEENSDTYCAKGEDDLCRIPSKGLKDLYTGATTCWTNTTIPSPGYVLENFCNPQLTVDSLPSGERRVNLEAAVQEGKVCGPKPRDARRRLNADMTSIYSNQNMSAEQRSVQEHNADDVDFPEQMHRLQQSSSEHESISEVVEGSLTENGRSSNKDQAKRRSRLAEMRMKNSV